MDLLLTPQERDKFATWLEHEAATAKGLVEQLEKLGSHTALIVAREKLEASAALVIARKLRATQSMSIG
jgi:hypothetical protein